MTIACVVLFRVVFGSCTEHVSGTRFAMQHAAVHFAGPRHPRPGTNKAESGTPFVVGHTLVFSWQNGGRSENCASSSAGLVKGSRLRTAHFQQVTATQNEDTTQTYACMNVVRSC
mmetsp:Transcript_24960/g.42709  ORF Transcript_24960/g.42709 Transcript_24960/m.42709 type:complete len:115 (-) Transcript_24960:1001-1345(-)